MIGAPLSTTASLFSTASLGLLGRPAAPSHTSQPAWLEGLSAGAALSLRADVALDQRGLTVQQHADRVLRALIG